MNDDELKSLLQRQAAQETAQRRDELKNSLKTRAEKRALQQPPAPEFRPPGMPPVRPDLARQKVLHEHNLSIGDRREINARTDTLAKKFNLEAAQNAAIQAMLEKSKTPEPTATAEFNQLAPTHKQDQERDRD
jgi:hypothetical protein